MTTCHLRIAIEIQQNALQARDSVRVRTNSLFLPLHCSQNGIFTPQASSFLMGVTLSQLSFFTSINTHLLILHCGLWSKQYYDNPFHEAVNKYTLYMSYFPFFCFQRCLSTTDISVISRPVCHSLRSSTST